MMPTKSVSDNVNDKKVHCSTYILESAKQLNQAFSYLDLQGPFTYGTLRNNISKLRKEGKILKFARECPARFILSNWKHRPEYKRWFQNDKTPMGGRARLSKDNSGVKFDFAIFVESLDWSDLAFVHDVKVEFDAARVDGVSSSAGWHWSSRSHSWMRRFNLEFPLTAQVYNSGRIQVSVRCSLKPIPFSFQGLTRLTAVLGELKGQLGWSNVPNVTDWTVTSWHYGKDSLKEVSGAPFSVTFQTWASTLARIYAKSELKKIRVEEIQSPHRTLQDLFESVINRHGAQ